MLLMDICFFDLNCIVNVLVWCVLFNCWDVVVFLLIICVLVMVIVGFYEMMVLIGVL